MEHIRKSQHDIFIKEFNQVCKQFNDSEREICFEIYKKHTKKEYCTRCRKQFERLIMIERRMNNTMFLFCSKCNDELQKYNGGQNNV